MPSFWNRASAAWNVLVGHQQKYDSHELFLEIFGGRSTWSGKEVSLTTALQVSTALACGRVIAESLSLMPWKVYQQRGLIKEPIPTHPIYDKISTSPNPIQTAFEFQETMGLHLSFCGNAFVWLPTVRGQIDAMYLIEPGWMSVKWKWPELPEFKVKTPDGRDFPLSSSEIWHIRGPSWSSYYGLEFTKVAREALGLSMAIEEGQARIHGQGVQTSGFLSIDGKLTEDQHKKLLAFLEKDHTGSLNAGRPMVLDNAAKWISTTMSNTDAQTLEQRRLQIEEVCRFMRVLPIMVGHADKTATYASAEQMFLAHAMYTTGPWARRIEQSADKRLLTPEERREGYYTNLNEKALLRMTAREQAEILTRYTGGPIMNRNEARAILDMNPIDGLDVMLAPANTFVGNPPSGDRQADPALASVSE